MQRFAAMECFVRVIEAGSFSGAARVLRVGQPSVSKTVAQLEEHLGVRLLLRSTHGLTPTEAGRNYYDHARLALEEAEEAELAARGAGTALTGRLRISAATTFARIHVMPHLGTFLRHHPALEIDVILDDRNIDLIAEGVDLALRMGQLPDSQFLARKLGSSPRLVLATPDYLEQRGVPRSPGDLSRHQAVIYDRAGGGSDWTFRRGEVAESVHLSGRLAVNAAEGVREAVFAGLGFTISSSWMFSPELASGRVVSVLEGWHLPGVDLWAVSPGGRQMSAKARVFTQFLEGVLAAEMR